MVEGTGKDIESTGPLPYPIAEYTRSTAKTSPHLICCSGVPGTIRSTIQEIHERAMENRQHDLRAQIADGERQGDFTALARLTQQKLDLDRTLRQLHVEYPRAPESLALPLSGPPILCVNSPIFASNN